jgi:hypothetical protein
LSEPVDSLLAEIDDVKLFLIRGDDLIDTSADPRSDGWIVGDADDSDLAIECIENGQAIEQASEGSGFIESGGVVEKDFSLLTRSVAARPQ